MIYRYNEHMNGHPELPLSAPREAAIRSGKLLEAQPDLIEALREEERDSLILLYSGLIFGGIHQKGTQLQQLLTNDEPH